MITNPTNGDTTRVMDRGGRLWCYHKSSNITLDRTGKLVSYHSNQLLRLLPKP